MSILKEYEKVLDEPFVDKRGATWGMNERLRRMLMILGAVPGAAVIAVTERLASAMQDAVAALAAVLLDRGTGRRRSAAQSSRHSP